MLSCSFKIFGFLAVASFCFSASPSFASFRTKASREQSIFMNNTAINAKHMTNYSNRIALSNTREKLTGPQGGESSHLEEYLKQYDSVIKELTKTIQDTNKMEIEFVDKNGKKEKMNFEDVAYQNPQKAYELLRSRVFASSDSADFNETNMVEYNRTMLLKHEIPTSISYGLWNERRAFKAKKETKQKLQQQIQTAKNLRTAQVAYSMSELVILIEMIAKAQSDIHIASNNAMMGIMGLTASIAMKDDIGTGTTTTQGASK